MQENQPKKNPNFFKEAMRNLSKKVMEKVSKLELKEIEQKFNEYSDEMS